MTRTKKKTLAVLMALSVVIPGSIAPTSEAAAKKVKLSKTKVSIQVGKTKKITIKNAKKGAKVTWKTSNKKVVKIVKSKKKGKKAYAVIKGAKKGTATLRAIYKVGKKKKTMKCKVKVTKNTANKIATKQPTAPTKKPVSPSGQPTAVPTQSVVSATPAVESKSNYSFFDDYTLGYDKDNKKIVAYKDGKQMSLEEAGAKVYNNYGDNIFASQIADNKWNADNIKLTAPLQYTTEDGKVHDINSMLTNYDFIADPTALDNSDNDGKLYVYGTNEGFDYADGKLAANSYSNNSLSILSTSDMVNWTDHGSPLAIESFDWADDRAWASQCIERNGKFYWYVCLHSKLTNTMAIGVAVGDSPTGPFKDAIGRPLYEGSWDFIDPTVFVDDDGQAYLYWGNPNVYYAKLNADMVSLDGEVSKVEQTIESFGSPGPDKREKGKKYKDIYTEGPWLHKRGGTYYLSYAAGGVPEHIAYSMSDTPTGPWKYMGEIMPLQDTGSFTNHCGVTDYKGNSYFFYHTGKLPGGGGFGRSVAVEQFSYNPDGTFPIINATTEGVSPVGTLTPYQRVEAETIAFSEGVKSEWKE